jgi:hypothetical protein
LTDVSEELTVMIALLMDAADFSETMDTVYQTAWRYIPEDSHLL